MRIFSFLMIGAVLGGLVACKNADPHRWSEALVGRASQELHLSATQQESLRTLVAQVTKEADQRWQAQSDFRQNLVELGQAPSLDKSALKSLLQTHRQALANEMDHPSDEVLDQAVAFFNSLKPEQKNQVLAWLQKKTWWGGER